jgi:hypothetical protein
MIDDPIVEEMRKHREEHASTYGHDLRRIIAALREREAQSKRPVLNPGPKYLLHEKTGKKTRPDHVKFS